MSLVSVKVPALGESVSEATIAACTSIGMLVDMPFTYTSCVSNPSGSRKI